MTALTLDFRAPIVVLAGDFNAAIFEPGWVAKHLFGLADGDVISAYDVVIDVGAGFVQIRFIEGVALNVAATRIELFAIDGSEQTLGRVEEVLGRVVEVLPHTPLKAIGCNFQYADADADPAISALFETPEGVEGEYPVLARQTTIQAQLDGAVLNFVRTYDGETVVFRFNYHRAETDPGAYAKLFPGLIAGDLEHSLTLLRRLYGYDRHETATFLPAPQEETPNEDQAAVAGEATN